MNFQIAGNIKEVCSQFTGKFIIHLIPDCEFRIGKYAILMPNEDTAVYTNAILVPFEEYLEIELPGSLINKMGKHIRIVVEDIPGIKKRDITIISDKLNSKSNSSTKTGNKQANVTYKLIELWWMQ